LSSRVEEHLKNPLWPILVETVHSLVMYRRHKNYVMSILIHEAPAMTPDELSAKMKIPLGEAMVILHEVRSETPKKG